MASKPTDGDDFAQDGVVGQTDDWVVNVDIFDVELSFQVTDGNARLIDESCNCDISNDVCRHIAIAEGQVRGVFSDDDLDGVKGRITEAPSLWRPLVDEIESVASSDTAVQ